MNDHTIELSLVPAFPVTAGNHVFATGMTLRDWYAGKAMEAELVAAWGASSIEGHEYGIARRAFAMANAMLEARK
jgi:hypothetical protein